MLEQENTENEDNTMDDGTLANICISCGGKCHYTQDKCDKCISSDLDLEPGSAEVTLTDVYAMFYILVKQSQKLHLVVRWNLI